MSRRNALQPIEGGRPSDLLAPLVARDGKPTELLAPQAAQSGFSLIEAMVALAVLAIASVGLIRTVETHIDSTRGMEMRAEAMWVAQNRLAEINLGLAEANREQEKLLQRDWRIATARSRTTDPAIDKLHIEVFAAEGTTPLATLDGFVAGQAG